MAIPLQREDSANNNPAGWSGAFNKTLRRRGEAVLAASICVSFRGARSASYDVQLHIGESIHPHVLWLDGFRVCAFGASRSDGGESLNLLC
jgi:hypothetical protein